MAKQPIGIVIGSQEVMMYQDLGQELLMTVDTIPEGLIVNGQIMDSAALAARIAEIKSRDGFQGRDCALALPEYGVYFRNLEMQPMTEEELKINLPFEFQDFTGDNREDYIYDYAMDEILYDKADNAVLMRLFGAAASKAAVKEWADMLEAAGLKIDRALPREMALVNLFRSSEQAGSEGAEYCLINIGSARTIVYIIKDSRLQSERMIEHGGSSANYEQICTEIRKFLNFYEYENQGSNIKAAYFCGSDADNTQLRSAITGYLDMLEGDITDILPAHCGNLNNAYRGLLAIGVTL